MKKRNILIATLLVAATAMVAVVSCKKENRDTLLNNNAQPVRAFTPPQVDDMNAYLKEFKQKMQTITRDENEMLSLEEAAWHLACLANVKFCRVNVEYDNIQFDTVVMQINVTDGAIALYDLNTAYNQMCDKIQQFKSGFNLYNQNLYFINMFISGNGNAELALTTSSISSRYLDDHLWYLDDLFYDTVCSYYFNDYSQYTWNGYGESELQRILNLFEHHDPNSLTSCYIPTRHNTFCYPNWPDPYGNHFEGDSRVFAADVSIGAIINLSQEDMCYCLDSYLGLGYDYIDDNPLYQYESPVNWIVDDTIICFPLHKHPTHMHLLTVQYGRLILAEPEPDPHD